MNELVKVDLEKQTVSARDLYESVGSTERFSTWFERQLQFGFESGVDYSNPLKVLRVQKEGDREVSREIDDYQLSVDMAKQICMVQKNDRAREVRQYLIDLEKAWNTPEQLMARALKVADNTIDSLKIQCKKLGSEIEMKSKVIEELKPKATYYDLILQCKDLLSMTAIAKDYGMSATAMNKILNDMRIQFKQSGRWYLYSKYDGFGYVQSKTENFQDSNGNLHAKTHMYWTQKGRLFLYEEFKKNEIFPEIEKENS